MPFLLIASAIVLRLVQFLHHRSLWFDEALLALNILNRSYSSLIKPLDYDQGAPLGFLFVERFVGTHLGFGESALRLIPLLAGMASLYLFYKVAQRTLLPRSLWIAVGLIAVCPHLIYYSSEVKQYSTDVLVCVALYLVILNFLSRPTSTRTALALGISGAIAVWCSHPAVIVLAGAGGATFVRLLVRRDWRKLVFLVFAISLWCASFLAVYFASLREVAKNRFLYLYWAGGFMPHDLTAIGTWKWLFGHFVLLFKNPGGMLGEPAAICFLCGCVALFRRDRDRFWIIITPFFVALLLSYLGRYPFEGRLLLFLAPLIFLLVAEGTNLLVAPRTRSVRIIGYALIVLVAAQPVARSTKFLFGRKSGQEEEIRPVLQTVKAHSQPGDVCYIYHWARSQYSYYSTVYHLGCENTVLGNPHIDTPVDYNVELNALTGHPRVWLIFSHNQRQEEDFITIHAMKIGQRLAEYKDFKASAYLFDFSRRSPAPISYSVKNLYCASFNGTTDNRPCRTSGESPNRLSALISARLTVLLSFFPASIFTCGGLPSGTSTDRTAAVPTALFSSPV